MSTPVEIMSFDSKGSHGPTRWAIWWNKFGGCWWTGHAITSARLKPRIKYFRSLEAARKSLPLAQETADKCANAQY